MEGRPALRFPLTLESSNAPGGRFGTAHVGSIGGAREGELNCGAIWMRVRASDWTMKELRNVQNLSQAMRAPHDGMISLGGRTSAGPSGYPTRSGWQNSPVSV